MPEFLLKYADARGEIHQQAAEAVSEQEVRNRFTEQGYLVYSVRPREGFMPVAGAGFGRRKKLNLGKFLIFNQQFVTLVRAGLPILKALDLLAERLTDAKLGGYVRNVRDGSRTGRCSPRRSAARASSRLSTSRRFWRVRRAAAWPRSSTATSPTRSCRCR